MPDFQKKSQQLRNDYPFLIFEGFHLSENVNTLQVQYIFNLSGKVIFNPVFVLEDKWGIKSIPVSILNNLTFHIGMVELISYWKATCSPEIIVAPFALDKSAVEWWKKIFFYGLGEFFYSNRIQPDYQEFLSIKSTGTQIPQQFHLNMNKASLVPLGGGKDSAVAIEILTEADIPVIPFFLNPTFAATEVARKAGSDPKKFFIIKRRIDPELLRMNEMGFLNGHTPFSALLAFYSLLAGAICGSKNIVLSNESSANEPTIPGTEINHQFSKSFSFESSFREYCNKYISSDYNYFSLLRPLNEIQIASLFSGFTKYHQVFRSCNAGSREGVWCGKCSKCLFTYIVLSPFFESRQLIEVFGRDLLDDMELSFYFNQLCGLEDEKPFDCIGTLEEVNAALHATIKKYAENQLPALLRYYTSSKNYMHTGYDNFRMLLSQFNDSHFLAEPFLSLLKNRLYEKNC